MKPTLHLIFILSLIPSLSFPLEKVIEGNVVKGFGSSKYTIEFDIDDDVKATSELEFPMDVYLCGLKLSLGRNLPRNHDIWFYVGGYMSMSKPKKPMTDIDKIKFAFEDIQLTWSSTESEARGKIYDLSVASAVSFVSYKEKDWSASFRFGFGYLYRKASYRIYGVKGWVLDEFLRRFYFDVLHDTCVLEYEVRLKAPHFLFNLEAIDKSGFNLACQAGYSPWASIEDYDDHLLRFKRGTSNCKGSAFLGDLSVMYFFRNGGANPKVFMTVRGNIVYASTEGYQTQSWYGDDPNGDGDETGMVIEQIDDTIVMTSWLIGVSLGIKF